VPALTQATQVNSRQDVSESVPGELGEPGAPGALIQVSESVVDWARLLQRFKGRQSFANALVR